LSGSADRSAGANKLQPAEDLGTPGETVALEQLISVVWIQTEKKGADPRGV
jgi:hypothetical protein